MTRTRRTPSSTQLKGGIKSLPVKEARAIRERLREWSLRGANPRYKSQQHLAEQLGVGKATVSTWFAKNPSTPTSPALLQLARAGLSINWLLTGGGPENHSADRPQAALSDALRRHVLDEIERTAESGDEELAVSLIPESSELLSDFVRYWWEERIARKLNERRGERVLELLTAQDQREFIAEKSLIHQAMLSGFSPAQSRELATHVRRFLKTRSYSPAATIRLIGPRHK
jgi:transcriptional regulator with XRE-family HTH domain